MVNIHTLALYNSHYQCRTITRGGNIRYQNLGSPL